MNERLPTPPMTPEKKQRGREVPEMVKAAAFALIASVLFAPTPVNEGEELAPDATPSVTGPAVPGKDKKEKVKEMSSEEKELRAIAETYSVIATQKYSEHGLILFNERIGLGSVCKAALEFIQQNSNDIVTVWSYLESVFPAWKENTLLQKELIDTIRAGKEFKGKQPTDEQVLEHITQKVRAGTDAIAKCKEVGKLGDWIANSIPTGGKIVAGQKRALKIIPELITVLAQRAEDPTAEEAIAAIKRIDASLKRK